MFQDPDQDSSAFWQSFYSWHDQLQSELPNARLATVVTTALHRMEEGALGLDSWKTRRRTCVISADGRPRGTLRSRRPIEDRARPG